MNGFKTYTGIFVTVLGMVGQHFKLNISTADNAVLVDNITLAVQAVGALFAVYGRTRAGK